MQTLPHVYKIIQKRTQIDEELVMCKPFLMSTKSIQKHTQIDEELVHSVLPLFKKKNEHAHTLTIVTTPSSHTLGHDWMHTAQHAVTKFELSRYTALELKVCRFLHSTGIGAHVCHCAAYSHHFNQECDLFTFTEKHQTNLLGSC